jgi:drug/metabolite transporter (DMT)-like permease
MWLLYSLWAAVFDTSRDAISKQGFQAINLGPFTMSWGLSFFGSIFMAPGLLFFGIPKMNVDLFFFSLITAGMIHVFATANYFSAIKLSDLSATGPLTCFTPLFLLLISPLASFFLGQDPSKEIPNTIGFLGVALVVSGAYITNIKDKRAGYLSPIKYIIKNRNAKKVLLSPFCWSITLSLDNIAMSSLTYTHPIQSTFFWGTLLLSVVSIFNIPFVVREINTKKHRSLSRKKLLGQQREILKDKDQLKMRLSKIITTSKSKRKPKLKIASQNLSKYNSWIGWLGVKSPNFENNPNKMKIILSSYKKKSPISTPHNYLNYFKILISIGLTDALITICHMMAVSSTVAAYATAVKCLAILFKVLVGIILFKECYLEERIVGTVIMVLGVVCITTTY